ncbi:hypothetical protein MKW94_026739 [Papaver nudicaule]|uniref:non-specific serine/threonine protein kinase n=1 Tax=Papaver nudicaule TaxID=74823 RepID=A0AA41SNP2_PAPNU|nr:hypothetical protein [Papaver nudicaule]
MDLEAYFKSLFDPEAKGRNPKKDSGGFSISTSSDDLSSIGNRKFPRRLRPSTLLEECDGKVNMSMPNSVTPSIRRSLRVAATGKPNNTTDDDRYKAIVEQAIDPRTRMVLFKMLKRANVYHATKRNGQEFAVKVYKTTPVLEFKDRRHGGYCKPPNPEKVAQARAENEMTKLKRLKAAGIRCPTPLHLMRNVLVMEFIGKSGRAAPRLVDANLSEEEMRECYVQMIMAMRSLYQKCELVHGELSEDTVLYHEGNVHIIDVPQSVDLDDPEALYYLFLDCIHVTSFFGRKGVGVVSTRRLFDFIIDSSISDESEGLYIEEVRQKILAWGVIMSELISESGIPRSATGQLRICSQYCSTAQKQLPEQPNVSDRNDPSTDQTNNCGTEPETDENDEEVDDDSSSGSKRVEPYVTTKDGAHETLPADKKAARKENKKKVKEEKREARKSAKDVRKKKKKLSKPGENHFLGSPNNRISIDTAMSWP